MLKRIHPTLPSLWYHDPGHYRRELKSIWWNSWLCVARVSEWSATGSYQVIRIGSQQILITRSANGELHAFHNTCRHRGSLLCDAAAGRFKGKHIVCPYHAWTYSLEGELLRTPRKAETADFHPGSFPLYRVALRVWAGFVFVNLAPEPAFPFEAELGEERDILSNWPMDELALAHREIHTLNCNWKIFWENFLECYHCPKIHPELCRLVPIYGQGVVSPADLPAGHPMRGAGDRPRLAGDAVTWSANGQTTLPWFPGLNPTEKTSGMTFCNVLPSVFIVAHVDYVRSVHVQPLGPEQTRLTVNWLVLPDVLDSGKLDIQALISFGNQVVTEDARVCELNQRGLHSLAHEHGILAPQEYDVLAFDNWVRSRLGELEVQH